MAILFTVSAYAYEWDSIGPTNLHVNNFSTIFYNVSIEVLCTSTGIVINEGNNWVEYSYGDLPAWDVVGLDPNNILVLLGNGSWSDGIYNFNLTNHQFEVVEWIAFPTFLKYCQHDSTYYAGGTYGMWKSSNGINFESMSYFNSKKCWSFENYENHYVVCAATRIYTSHDCGISWIQGPAGSPTTIDMNFNNDGELFGILPGDSYSAGLWSSDDFGQEWGNEYWQYWLTTVEFDSYNEIFVGSSGDGVMHWDPNLHDLEYYNEGLPNKYINNIKTHPDIDCNNIVACTNSGAYLLTDYTVGTDEIIKSGQASKLDIYPNPVHFTTNIVFTLPNNSVCEINIYDIYGNVIENIFEGIAVADMKYTILFSTDNIPQGIYYCRMSDGSNIDTSKKIIVVK
jgi:type IX secretion system substrate protein